MVNHNVGHGRFSPLFHFKGAVINKQCCSSGEMSQPPSHAGVILTLLLLLYRACECSPGRRNTSFSLRCSTPGHTALLSTAFLLALPGGHHACGWGGISQGVCVFSCTGSILQLQVRNNGREATGRIREAMVQFKDFANCIRLRTRTSRLKGIGIHN